MKPTKTSIAYAIKQDAPEWARFIAQDETGAWFYWEIKPIYKKGYWCREDEYRNSKAQKFIITKPVFPRISLMYIGEKK